MVKDKREHNITQSCQLYSACAW